jgi:hypothetical protein
MIRGGENKGRVRSTRPLFSVSFRELRKSISFHRPQIEDQTGQAGGLLLFAGLIRFVLISRIGRS